MADSPFHVMIIGAGTGGMCLAHGLKRAGISVSVFERCRTRADGLQGYRVGINPDGSRALHLCLPPELYDIFVATCAKPPLRVNMLTEKFSEVLSLDLPSDQDPVNSEKSVSRMTLRQVLLTGMEDVVQFDKKFIRYEQNSDDTVTAFFEDGSTATGDILVAADGTRSRVRGQYLPHAKIKDAEVVAVAAKIPLNDETRALLPERLREGSSMVFAPRGHFLIMHMMEFPWDHRGMVKSGVGGDDAELIANWPGLLYDTTRDHIILGISAKADDAPANILQTKGADLVPIAKSLTSGWHPLVHQLLDYADPGSIFSHTISTSVPIPPWPSSNITLIGDAIHTMTPGRGVGANTALRDASLLCRKLAAAARGEQTVIEAIAAYESRMIQYGFQAVRDSLKSQGADSPLYKPVFGRVLLAGMRTGMRLVNAVPPVKKKMAEGFAKSRGADRDED